MAPAQRRLPELALAVAVLASLSLGPLLRPASPERPGKDADVSRSHARERKQRSLSLVPQIDVHVHLASDGFERLEALMREYGIEHVVNLSGRHPLGGLSEDVARASRSGRVTVFTNLAYEQTRAPGYGERMAELLRRSHALGARGLKIAKALGLGLRGPDGGLLAVDDPGLDPVFETAGALGMPVAIHSGDPEAFFRPVDASNERRLELEAHPGWALHGRDVPSFGEILSGLERRVARHPRTTFISVHFGNNAEHPEQVAEMLRRYPNLYIDTAARIPEIGRQDPRILRAFFIEFQDRVLYGSDLGVGPPGTPLFLGSQGKTPPGDAERELFFTATRRYFESADRAFAHPTPIQGSWTIDGIELPRAVLEKIYRNNARHVLRLDEAPRQ